MNVKPLVWISFCGLLCLATTNHVLGQDKQEANDDVKRDIQRLVGDYTLVNGKSNGDDVLKERLADVTVKITERTITTYDRDRQEQFNASYKLNTDETPWKILMTSIPKKRADPSVQGKASTEAPAAAQGLVEVSKDGKKVKIIYALPGGEAPKDFRGGKGQNLFELQRLEKQ